MLVRAGHVRGRLPPDQDRGRQVRGRDQANRHHPGQAKKQTDILQAETKGVYEAGTKQTDLLQAGTEGAKYEVGTKQTTSSPTSAEW